MASPRCTSVFITGCNRGLGLEFVRQFLHLPSPPEFLFATCRSLGAATELNKLASENPNLHVLELDIDDFEGIKRVASEVSDKLQDRGMNMLLNNAGIMNRQIIGKLQPEDMIRIFKTNTVSTTMVTQAFLPLLKTAAKNPMDKSSPKAVIASVSTGYASSTCHLKGMPYPYIISKGAVNTLTRAMNDDLKSFGITAVSLEPGWVQTDMGGSKAPLTPQQSISGLIRALGCIDESALSGMLKYDGTITPW